MNAIQRIHSKLTAVKAAALLEEAVGVTANLAEEADPDKRREGAADLCVLIHETAVLLRKDIHDVPALDRVVELCQATASTLLSDEKDS